MGARLKHTTEDNETPCTGDEHLEIVSRVISCQINTGHNTTHSELNDFLSDCSLNGEKYSCQILLFYGHKIFESRHPKMSENIGLNGKFLRFSNEKSIFF
jgi:hypothetical protein